MWKGWTVTDVSTRVSVLGTAGWNVCFLRTKWCCMRGPSQRDLQDAFDRFSAACDQEGTKISSKKIEVLCLSRRPKQCSLQVSRNTLQQVETFKYLGVVFTSDGSRNKGIDTRIGKANAVLRELFAPWWRNWSFQRTQSFQMLNRFLFRSSPVVMNLRWRLKEYYQKNKRQRWDICEEFLVWHFVIRSTGLKSVKPGMSRYFSESRDSRYVSSAMCPICPRKEWRTKSYRPQSTPKGKRPKVCPRSSWSDYIWPCLVLSWCGASRTIWDCCWSWGIAGHPRLLPPQLYPKEKRTRKQ